VPTGGGPRTTLFGATGRATLGDPVYSPDGTRIAYPRTPARGVADVWVVDAAGGIPRRLTVTPIPPRGTPKTGSTPIAWSPDGTKLLVFRHDRFAVVDVASGSSTPIALSRADVVVGPGRWTGDPPSAGHDLIAFERAGDIWVVRRDGTGYDRLTDGGTSHDPAWSPDGRRIAFTSDRDRTPGARELWSMNADGSAERRLTASLGQPFLYAIVGGPAWSPDGRWLAFTREVVSDGHRLAGDLWSVGSEGENQLRLSETPQHEATPSFARDGDLVWEQDGVVWLQDGGTRAAVTTGTEPQLSPDGTRIALVRDAVVTVVRRDGSAARPLARGLSPAWSPDGRELVFAGADGLFVTPADDPAPTRLTRGADLAPSWRGPLGR
jgi:Tol biopolymer transport system component